MRPTPEETQKEANRELNILLTRIRILNEYIKIYQDGYNAQANGTLNLTVVERNFEGLVSDLGLDLEDMGFLQIKDLIPDNFEDERMRDLLNHALEHTAKIQPLIQDMIDNPNNITVSFVEKAFVEVNRAFEDLTRDKNKLNKQGAAGNYLLTTIFRGFENIGLTLLKVADYFSIDKNKAYTDEFQKHEESLEQSAVNLGAKAFAIFSSKAAERLKAKAASSDIGGSLQDKMRAESDTMSKLPKRRKNK
tara:strand:- start:7493 stop:8239 length:747 start_codon:yes stop_codon:yes gene_type:complete